MSYPLFNGISMDFDFSDNVYVFKDTESEEIIMTLDEITMDELFRFVKQTKDKMDILRSYAETHPIKIDGDVYEPIECSRLKKELDACPTPRSYCTSVCDLRDKCDDRETRKKIPFCRSSPVTGGRIDGKNIVWKRKVTK